MAPTENSRREDVLVVCNGSTIHEFLALESPLITKKITFELNHSK